jgi:predicted dehydrogenase
MSVRLNRRRFLQTGTAAGLGYLFTGPAFSVSKAFGAGERLRVAGIGTGGKGRSDIEQAGELMEVVALCDADEDRGFGKIKFNHAEKFTDYRKLFDSPIIKQVDAVTVSTPDHHHAPASIRAMLLGKHVYTQKPLTHTVFEARMMKEVAARQKVCTQMGNQGSAAPGLRRAVELVQSGLIGGVAEVHIWTDRPREYWKQSPDIVARPKETPPVPPYVHWESFLGPAPERPYSKAYHPFAWRGWWDFGTGAIGDMACHTANMAFRALKLQHPTSAVAESGELNPETYPAWAHVTFQFPARDGMPAVTVHWYEGKKDGKKLTPPEELLGKVLRKGEKLAGSGSVLVGDKGILFSPNDYGAAFRLTPESLGEGKNLTRPEKLPAYTVGRGDVDPLQKKEWVEAIKAGKPSAAYSNFDYASLLTETFLIGNIAVRMGGEKLEWDGPGLRFTNSPKATQFVTKVYRKGWELGVREKA